MPSIRALYNDEVIQAHREAIAALRELLAETTDPLERRRLATALLKARPVKELTDDQAATPDTGDAVERPAQPPRSSTLHADEARGTPDLSGVTLHTSFLPDAIRPLAPRAYTAADAPSRPQESSRHYLNRPPHSGQ